ncbi:periostin-like [Sinocyclocheilus rhinocerous]|uniref:periostin-like n=1 Tax=Sinocyclocheilus rhinocerous TaxID=307959 RepID=UPI0007B9D17A|nr:PREDICTED: periostin-like [Sinocyclocheilus rhinocerous]
MILLFTATFTILVLSSLDQVESSAYDKIVMHSRIRAKNEGPNVCALQRVMGTKKKYFSTCRNWYNKSICGKKAVVLYECCPGYMKLDGKHGCPAVAPIDTVYGTLDLVQAKITQRYSDQSKLREELDGAGSYTMFAPNEDAWEELEPASKAALVSSGNTELYNALHYHMVNKRLLTKDLKNDMTLESMYNKQGLYINHYSNGVVTVNCARIIHANQVATNGVVHVIDRIISVISQTIKDVIETNDDLASLNTVALRSGLQGQLGEPGHYTLFAPTNKAFEKLDSDVLERLMSDTTVLQALLKYHLLNSVQCSEAIMAGSVYGTIEGSNTEIGCDGESLTVNGIKMVLKKDIVTSNGVIHLIDQVLMPDSAKQVMELIGKSQSIFSDMVSELGLSAAMQPETEYTILAPLNGAFSVHPGSGPSRWGWPMGCVMVNNSIHVNSVEVPDFDLMASNGVVHVVKTILYPQDLPVGREDILILLKRLIRYIQLKFVSGYTYHEIPLTFIKRTITTHVIEKGPEVKVVIGEPSITKVTRVIGGDLSVTKVTQVAERDPSVTKVTRVIGGDPSVTKVTQVTERDPSVAKVTRVIGGDPSVTKVTQVTEREPSVTKVTRVKGGDPSVTKVTQVTERDPSVTKVTRVIGGDSSVTKVTQVTERDPSVTKVTRVNGGDPNVTKVTQVTERDPSVTKVTRVNGGDPNVTKVTQVTERDPSVTKVTRVIGGDPSITKVTQVIGGDPGITKVVEGKPSVTKITRLTETHSASSDGEIDTEGEIKILMGEDITKVQTFQGGDVRILQEEDIKQITDAITQGGGPGITTITKVIKPGVQVVETEPGLTTLTRVIKKDPQIIEIAPGETTITRVIQPEPQIIEGPDFSKIVSFKDSPDLLESESERITRIIKEGRSKKRAAIRQPQGSRRRVRLVRHHSRPRQ